MNSAPPIAARRAGLLPHRDGALLAALAAHAEEAALDVHRRAWQRDQFGDTQAGAVHELDHGGVAHPQRVVTVGVLLLPVIVKLVRKRQPGG